MNIKLTMWTVLVVVGFFIIQEFGYLSRVSLSSYVLMCDAMGRCHSDEVLWPTQLAIFSYVVGLVGGFGYGYLFKFRKEEVEVIK
jgi:hypothetical protein